MRELTPPSISQMYTVLVHDKAAFSGERSPFHSGFARKVSCWSLLMRLLLAGNFISYSLAIEIILSSRGWGWFLQLYRRIFRVKLGLWGISRHTHSNGNSNKCSNRIKCGDQKTYPWCYGSLVSCCWSNSSRRCGRWCPNYSSSRWIGRWLALS